jgi:hypothetical protein
MNVVTALQVVPELGVPQLLTTVIAAVVALVILRFLLNVALKIAIVAAVVVAVLWFFGALSLLPIALLPA